MRRALVSAVLVLFAARDALAATATSTCTAASGWATTPTNVLAGPDSAFAVTAVTGQPALNVTSCAMGLPAGSTVNGIQIRVVGCGNGTTGQRTLDVNVLNLGTCTLKTTAQSACATISDVTLGGTADLWSCTSVSDTNVNATAFGATVKTDTSNSQTQQLDLVTLTVTYTAATTTTTTTATTTTTLTGTNIPVAGTSDSNCPTTPPPQTTGAPGNGNTLITSQTCATGSNAGGYDVQAIAFYLGTTSANLHVICSVYTDANPHVKVATGCDSATFTTFTNPNAYVQVATTGACHLAASTRYWVGCNCDDPGSGVGYGTDAAGPTNAMHYVAATYPSLPTPWTPTTDTHWLSAYMIASPTSGGTPTAPRRLFRF